MERLIKSFVPLPRPDKCAEVEFEAKMAPSLAKRASPKEPVKADATGDITLQSSWVGKHVRGLTGTRLFCEGVVESVTKGGLLKIKFDGDEKVSNATKPHNVIVLA